MGPQRKLVDYSKSKARLPCDADIVFPGLSNPPDTKKKGARTSYSRTTTTSNTEGVIGSSSSGAGADCREISVDGVSESLPSSPVELSGSSRCLAKPQGGRRVLRVSSFNNSDSSRLSKSGLFSTERGDRSTSRFGGCVGSHPSPLSDSPASISRDRSLSRSTSFDRRDIRRWNSPTSPVKLSRDSNGKGQLETQESANLKSPKSVFDELASTIHSVSPQRKTMVRADSSRENILSPTDIEKIKKEFSQRNSRRHLLQDNDPIPVIPSRGVLGGTSCQKQLASCPTLQKPKRRVSPQTGKSKTLQSAPMRSTSDRKMIKRLHEDLSRASLDTEQFQRSSKAPEQTTSDGESLMALHLEMRKANSVHRTSSR